MRIEENIEHIHNIGHNVAGIQMKKLREYCGDNFHRFVRTLLAIHLFLIYDDEEEFDINKILVKSYIQMRTINDIEELEDIHNSSIVVDGASNYRNADRLDTQLFYEISSFAQYFIYEDIPEGYENEDIIIN